MNLADQQKSSHGQVDNFDGHPGKGAGKPMRVCERIATAYGITRGGYVRFLDGFVSGYSVREYGARVVRTEDQSGEGYCRGGGLVISCFDNMVSRRSVSDGIMPWQ